MRFKNPLSVAYLYAFLNGNRVAASPLSAAVSEMTFDDVPTLQRRMVEQQVNCKFTIDNEMTGVWLDGVQKTPGVTTVSGVSIYTLDFDDTAQLLAISGHDAESGCANGGLIISCTSENTVSKWNTVNSDANRIDWLVSSNVGNYKVLGVDTNSNQWFQPWYITATHFAVARQATFDTALINSAWPNHPAPMCGGSSNENYWQFRIAAPIVPEYYLINDDSQSCDDVDGYEYIETKAECEEAASATHLNLADTTADIVTYTGTDVCVVQGLAGNDGNNWGLITTLPSACRPRKRIEFNLSNLGNFARVDVFTNGEIHWKAGSSSNTFLSLSGISFATGIDQTILGPYNTGFENYSTGGYGTLTYFLHGGACSVEGLLKAPSRARGVVTTLPSTCRPNARLFFDLISGPSYESIKIEVYESGDIMWRSSSGMSSNVWVSLTGISFVIAGTTGDQLLLENGWVPRPTGGLGTPTCYRNGNTCFVEGVVEKSLPWINIVIATLPVECHPSQQLVFNVNNELNSARVDVTANGEIIWKGGGSDNDWLSLTGISFVPADVDQEEVALQNSWYPHTGAFAPTTLIDSNVERTTPYGSSYRHAWSVPDERLRLNVGNAGSSKGVTQSGNYGICKLVLTAQKVRVQLQSNNYLVLTEVQVFDLSGTTNQALNKLAIQSSIYNNHGAALGVNGDLNDSVITNNTTNPWWEVDLGANVEISRVVFFPTPQYWYGLNYATVSLFHSNGSVQATHQLCDMTNMSSISISVSDFTNPSACPTMAPSSSPSSIPSGGPSADPSSIPSALPSLSPSSTPSSIPSASPSSVPSSIPSTNPSSIPSGSPSADPSSGPSALPSLSPSSTPSSIPSASPSSVPSSTPSTNPSSIPSGGPSADPSSGPSALSSLSPSSTPSSIPSVSPSSVPSSTPSTNPSSIPSGGPSADPSSGPSALPSLSPSSTPSSIPSGSPSSVPSSIPSTNPSSIPSGGPSADPSSSPSALPSLSPSSTPSSIPSASPSSVPSSIPSTNPSSIPSDGPSADPSSGPSALSSLSPSSTPSSIRSASPSSVPSLIQPSTAPSPTLSPTSIPSSNPTSKPTPKPPPTPKPTSKPTPNPTSTPSSAPSTIPTISPSSEICPPYNEDRIGPSCGDSNTDATMAPLFGPEVGGTVIQITNIKHCLNPEVNIYCLFGKNQVVDGIRVDDGTIECTTLPTINLSSIEVSYSVFIPDCFYSPTEVKWITINENFDFNGGLAGVVVYDNSNTGFYDSIRLIQGGKKYRVEWSSVAINLAAMENIATTSSLKVDFATKSSLKVDLEIFARVESEGIIFHKPLQTVTDIPNENSECSFIMNGTAILPALKTYSASMPSVALAHVRIVVYSITSEVRRIHAVRSTKLVGVFPENDSVLRMNPDFCPVIPLNICNREEGNNVSPCPPSYLVAVNDYDFTDDETCIWPSGNTTSCVVTNDLTEDYLDTCENVNDTQPELYSEYCGSIDPDMEIKANCDCKYYRNGAAGCVRKGQSQCCYSITGGLITDHDAGAGTRYCSSDSSVNFLYDILPYEYCCKLSTNARTCDAYYAERPAISYDGYISPDLPVIAFGDPHLQSMDKINFDFNGFGEYVVFCGKITGESVSNNIQTCQPNSQQVLKRRDTISVHYRFTKLDESHNATVTVGVAIEDPSFKKGREALAIVTHPTRGLDVYDGSNIVRFPAETSRTKKLRKKVVFGASMWMTSNTSPDFNIRISLASGLMLRIRENGFGVMTVSFLRLPTTNTTQYVGLLGIPDNDDTNDFTAANETVLNITSYASVSERYEGIFYDFGQSWMVRNKTSSLFQRLVGTNEFYEYYNPTYVPSFTFIEPGEDDNCPQDICGAFTGFLFESCCYDLRVTNDTSIVRAMMTDVVKEEEAVSILNNTVPVILNGRDQSISVEIGQNASFIIVTRDEDGDKITAALVRSYPDFGLYKVFSISSVMFGLSFAGSELDGTFKAQVSISDGKTPILFTASVKVLPPTCVNDRSYRYEGHKEKTCTWVEQSPSRRDRLCSRRKKVRDACRMTCGLCCADDPNYKYTLRSGFIRDCAWTAKKDSRSNKYCPRKKVKSNCPKTCANCQEKFTCVNNESFRIKNGNAENSCVWIGSTNVRRKKWCAKPRVSTNCPTSCGLCCENDPAFSFTTDNGISKDCAWIAKQVSRIVKYCPDERIKSSCPEKNTCNSCEINLYP